VGLSGLAALRGRVVRALALLAVEDRPHGLLLEVIEKEGAIGCLSEQLQSECQVSPSSPLS
jgi:hypothetical protein